MALTSNVQQTAGKDKACMQSLYFLLSFRLSKPKLSKTDLYTRAPMGAIYSARNGVRASHFSSSFMSQTFCDCLES